MEFAGSAGACANGLAGMRGPRGRGGWLAWADASARRPLPGTPGLDLAHRQKALGGDTLVGHDAEELARRQAGIFHENLEIVTRGKTFPRLPRADGGNGNPQILGDVLEENSILLPPVAESSRKAGANVTVELRLWGHGKRVGRVWV